MFFKLSLVIGDFSTSLKMTVKRYFDKLSMTHLVSSRPSTKCDGL